MNILFLDWKCFDREPAIRTLAGLGHHVFPFAHPEYNLRQSSAFTEACTAFIREKAIDLAFSWNYFPALAFACHENGIRYIAFLYDSPQIMLYSYTLAFETNRVFLFDRHEYEKFRQGGLTNVFYQVLPGSPAAMRAVWEAPVPAGKNYGADVSFVGSLYNEDHNFLDRVTAKGDRYLNGYLRGVIESQKKVWGLHFTEEVLTEDILRRLEKCVPVQPSADGVETVAYTYANYFLDRKITSEERISLLTAIGQALPGRCALYTVDQRFSIPGIENRGVAEYHTEMPHVFHSSRINLNISLRSIATGIPLRCMDIIAAGGFLLSNYQADLAEAFVPDTDFVYFEDPADLVAKIRYYLAHDKERARIAAHGLRTLSENYDFPIVFQKILSTALA